MIKLLGVVPHKLNIAFSGGVDSLVAAHFFQKGNRDLTLLHFNHKCPFSDEIEQKCVEKAKNLGIPIKIGTISKPNAPSGMSLEDYWRRCRYNFLRNANENQVVTAHHLDDAVETWIWSSLHGEGKLIPSISNQVIRPFLLTEKQELIDYAQKHGLEPVDDPYNQENHLTRNYMRANLMEHVYYVNPGLRKVIRKKYLS